MSARITEARRYQRGDTALGDLMYVGVVAVVVMAGTVAGLVAGGMWPGFPIVLRIFAGLFAGGLAAALLSPFATGGSR